MQSNFDAFRDIARGILSQVAIDSIPLPIHELLDSDRRRTWFLTLVDDQTSSVPSLTLMVRPVDRPGERQRVLIEAYNAALTRTEKQLVGEAAHGRLSRLLSASFIYRLQAAWEILVTKRAQAEVVSGIVNHIGCRRTIDGSIVSLNAETSTWDQTSGVVLPISLPTLAR